MLHGRDAAEESAETARKTFEDGELSENLPTVGVHKATLNSGIGVLALMVLAELCTTNGEARRHVEGGAVRINDEPVSDPRMTVDAGALNDQGVIKLSLGKKRHVLIRPA
jgi:tyrosyl-tRNA synthetase